MAAQIKQQNNVITNERGFERALSRKHIAKFSCLEIFANLCLYTCLVVTYFFLKFFFFYPEIMKFSEKVLYNSLLYVKQ